MSLSHFTVCDWTGTPVRRGSCPTEQVELQANSELGEHVVSEILDPDVHTIEIVDDPTYTGVYVPSIYTGEVIGGVAYVPPVIAPGKVIVPVAKATNAIAINKTTFSANSTDEVVISGVGTGAKVSVTCDVSMQIESFLDVVVTDALAIITSSEKGDISVVINDGITTPYRVTLHAI